MSRLCELSWYRRSLQLIARKAVTQYGSRGRLFAVASVGAFSRGNNRMGCVIRRLITISGMVLAIGLIAPKTWASGCDLYATSSTCTFNGGVYDVVGPHPTGTGVIDSF